MSTLSHLSPSVYEFNLYYIEVLCDLKVGFVILDLLPCLDQFLVCQRRPSAQNLLLNQLAESIQLVPPRHLMDPYVCWQIVGVYSNNMEGNSSKCLVQLLKLEVTGSLDETVPKLLLSFCRS